MALHSPAYMGLLCVRASALEQMQQLQQDSERLDNDWSASIIDARIDLLEGYWTRFQDIQQRLMLKYPNVDAVMQNFNLIEQNGVLAYAAAKSKLSEMKITRQPSARQVPRVPKASEIRVSKFTGKYTEWAGWRAEFQARVMDTTLDPADKINLLVGALSKEAATCAGRAERLDQLELERIWAKLIKTYDIKYQQVYAHISTILNIPQMVNASAERLRSMIDKTDEHLRMLRRFDIDTNHWSSLVCVILLNKLDPDTRNQWETKADLPEMPNLNALFVFLEQRILAIRNVEECKRQQQLHADERPGKSNKVQRSETNRHHPYNRDQRKSTSSDAKNKDDQSGKFRQRTQPPSCNMCGPDVHPV